MKGKPVRVFYTVQNFPGDDESHPNMFEMSTSEIDVKAGNQPLVTLGEVSATMLSVTRLEGRYHWRFRTTLSCGNGKSITAWRDVAKMTQAVPVTKGCVFARALRLDPPKGLPCSACRINPRTRTQTWSRSNGKGKPIRRNQRKANGSAPQKPSNLSRQAVSSDDMLSFGQGDRKTNQTRKQPRSSSAKTTIDPKLAHLSVEARAQARIKLRKEEERKQQVEKVQEKRLNEAREQALHDGKKAAEKEIGMKLTKWSGTEGNLKNIRALLGTLHTVLWDGARWKQQSVLVRAADVKKSYRKAMLVVHPDKVRASAPPEHHFIAERVFAALNREFKKFSAVEMR